MVLDERTVDRRRARARLTVHLGLIVTAAVSLTLEPVLTLHIALGLVFIGLVGAHLVQRRHTTSRLASRLVHPVLTRPSDRLALSDALLLALTVAMFGSGLWDWLAGRRLRQIAQHLPADGRIGIEQPVPRNRRGHSITVNEVLRSAHP